MREIVIDGFCGGGGASTGISWALGRSPDEAINHDPIAIGIHQANHPDTSHHLNNIITVDADDVVQRRPVGFAWFSPDCTHFSKARGGKPKEKRIRDLASVVHKYTSLYPKERRPRVICVENVEEFTTWEGFEPWLKTFRRNGYRVERRELVAADYGAPTTRKRLFIIARRDGKPIVWPKPTHGKPELLPVRAGKLQPWRTAASVIDWSLPCPSIFDSEETIFEQHGLVARRPLAENTLARIARGIQRYVLNNAKPFIVPITHTGDSRTHDIDEPMRTVTCAHRGEHALIAPTLVQTGYGERPGQRPRYLDLHAPLGTCVDGQKHAIVTAFLAQHNTDMVGHSVDEPVSTIVGKGCTQAVVSAGLAPTQCAGGWHIAEVRAFLLKWYGTDQDPRLDEPMATATTRDRFSLVTVNIGGEPYAIVDIGMRMLTPRELFRAQGFGDDYVIDRMPDGSPINKTRQIRAVGNSVCPQIAEAIVRANYSPEYITRDEPLEFALEAAE